MVDSFSSMCPDTDSVTLDQKRNAVRLKGKLSMKRDALVPSRVDSCVARAQKAISVWPVLITGKNWYMAYERFPGRPRRQRRQRGRRPRSG